MSKPRLFEQLPADVNDLILSRLPLRDLLTLRAMNRAGTAAVDNYLLKLININALAKLPRCDVADLLQKVCAPGSEYFERLQRAASQPDADAATYGLYALMANVTTLDAVKLAAVIAELQAQNCPPIMLRSLGIIHRYLTHGNNLFDHGLKALIENADGAYINLRGATLCGTFPYLDLSFADFRETGFYCLVSGASLECANFSDATFDKRTIFHQTKTTGMIVDRLTLGDSFVVETEVDAKTGAEKLAIPELAPVVAAQKEPGKKPQGGCNVM